MFGNHEVTTWPRLRAGPDVPFYDTIPHQERAAAITAPRAIEGPSRGLEVSDWGDASAVLDALLVEH